MSVTTREIARYYDVSQPFYRLFWHKNNESHALHYGFWDSGAKTTEEALMAENEFLAGLIGARPGMRILDAGCGVGGSSIFLAKRFGAEATGITLSEKQLGEANRLKTENNLADKLRFDLRDYTKTGFPSESFDVVWAIESVCHAIDKNEFLREAHRLLKPGGKLVVADGVRLREIHDAEEGAYKDFLDGLALPDLVHMSEFPKAIERAGFVSVKAIDKTAAVLPSVEKLYRGTSRFLPLIKIFSFVRLLSPIIVGNGKAGVAQYSLVRDGALGYGVFYAEKRA